MRVNDLKVGDLLTDFSSNFYLSPHADTLFIGPGVFNVRDFQGNDSVLPTDLGLIFLLDYLFPETKLDIIDLAPETNRGGSHNYVFLREMFQGLEISKSELPEFRWLPQDILEFSGKNYKQIFDHNSWQWVRNSKQKRDFETYVAIITEHMDIGSKYFMMFDPKFSYMANSPEEDYNYMKELLTSSGLNIKEISGYQDKYPISNNKLTARLQNIKSSPYCPGGFDLWDGSYLNTL
ncbi:MAG: hypothetical protein AABW92_02085, partial [Nanoarchaeota archaeon]